MDFSKVKGRTAYDAIYIDEVMEHFGYMCHCSVVLFNTPLEEFFPKFFDNYLCRGIEEGNPHYLVGYSGKEMAEMVLGRHSDVNNYFDIGSFWMWVGRSIALVQWYTSHSFKTILEMQPLPVWYYMFRAYHTADESHLLEWADSVFIRH